MNSITEKRCSKCKEIKPISDFWKNKRSKKDGLEGQCKDCHRQYWKRPEVIERSRVYKREYARANYKASRSKHYSLKRNHKITLQDFNRMFDEQNGACPVCRKVFENRSGRDVHVDHDHATGRIRMLLCYKCNLLLGYAKESVKTLQGAITYLKLHSAANLKSVDIIKIISNHRVTSTT